MKYILAVLFGLLLNHIIFAQIPIVKDNMLLGGVQNGKWLTAQQIAPQLKLETEFILIGPKGVKKAASPWEKKVKSRAYVRKIR